MALLPLERIALEQVRSGRPTPGGALGDEGWIQFGLHALLSVAGRVRLLTQPASVVSVKADGSLDGTWAGKGSSNLGTEKLTRK